MQTEDVLQVCALVCVNYTHALIVCVIVCLCVGIFPVVIGFRYKSVDVSQKQTEGVSENPHPMTPVPEVTRIS